MTILPEGAVLMKGAGNEFAGLGARLVRFGHALQEGSTTVGELVSLAQACGINFKLRVVTESGGGNDE